MLNQNNWITPSEATPTEQDFTPRNGLTVIEVQDDTGLRTFLVNDPATPVTALPSNVVAWRTPVADYILPVPTSFNHDVNRTQIIETVLGVESVLANYDYSVEPLGPTFAQGYIDTFGGERSLRVAYFAEQTGASTGLSSFAIVEELLDENNVPYEKVIEVKTLLAHAEGYVNIFAGTTRVLRVATLEETTQPVA